MRFPVCAALAITIISGCADMKVCKITDHDRVTGNEYKIKGFRYYLARPYVAVKKPVEISRQVKLIAVDPARDNWKWAEQFVAAYEQNPAAALRLVPHSLVQKAESGSDSFEPVSEAEWQAMRANFAQKASDVEAVSDNNAQLTRNAAESVSQVSYDDSGFAVVADVSDLQRDSASEFLSDVTPVAAVSDKSVSLNGSIDVLFLPDLDEQYAVHNRNWLAKSSYALQFKDGWQLASVNGEFDSTTVAIEVLNTVESAIKAAKKVGVAGLPLKFPSTAERSYVESDAPANVEGNLVFLEVVTVTRLRPGFYRVNKPWETDGQMPEAGVGLLAQMGLPTVTDTVVRPAQVHTNIPDLSGSAK